MTKHEYNPDLAALQRALAWAPESVRALVARILDGGEQATEDVRDAIDRVINDHTAPCALAARLRRLVPTCPTCKGTGRLGGTWGDGTKDTYSCGDCGGTGVLRAALAR